MQVTYSDRARQGKEGTDLLQGATRRLEEVVANHAPDIRADWDQTNDEQGLPLYTLRLAGWTDSATAAFTRDDLESPRELRWGLTRLYQQLLETHIDAMLRKLNHNGK